MAKREKKKTECQYPNGLNSDQFLNILSKNSHEVVGVATIKWPIVVGFPGVGAYRTPLTATAGEKTSST